ncbi:hypothetical protein HN371_24490 [Candidatus Poribacteria bacterium]|jgi:hypothetical protein|nr:hypothetical protein [Candidatus Poribacteria bacterium]MBT5533935.1 hypothetical protein [Candidatus Poribacteria bacterium]MBT7097552.1 hypothetical protein [Candidatus Poribacteria bacterium]MBT7804885.1 hypothetical protein [Candidatus Poribacteria bacterium]
MSIEALHGRRSRLFGTSICAIALTSLSVVTLGARSQGAASRPHVGRQGENRVANWIADTAEAWSFIGDASYDANASATPDGSGSIKLMTPYYDTEGGHREDSGRAHSDYIPVERAGKHTFAFYAKTANGPTYVTAMVSIHDGDMKFIRNLPGGRYGTTADGPWEECVLPVYVPEEASYVRVVAVKMADTRVGGEVWVDDFYFGEGVGLERPPTDKRAFDGAHVRVDELGNFEVAKDGRWEPFFPLCMYSDNRRDAAVYSAQGWNVIIWTSVAAQVQEARDAVSEFNPNGMFAGFQIPQYTFPSGWAYNDLDDLREQLEGVFAAGLGESLLLYYWDNENNHDQWDVPVDVIETLRSIDVDSAGRPRHPIYGLQGNFGVARVYSARGLVDVSGTYVGGGADATGGAGTGDLDGLLVLDRLEGQVSPAAFAQFNGVDGPGDMRLRLYNSIALGAKAMGYWRDCYEGCGDGYQETVGPVDEKAWWPDFPNLRREVDELLPLIREPHWTSWTVDVDPPGVARVGTRDYLGEAHLIVVNQTGEPQSVTLTVDGLPYLDCEVRDYFSGRRIAGVVDASFVVQLRGIDVGAGTQILRLAPLLQGGG